MEGHTERMMMRLTPDQNVQLEGAFKEFYQLDSSPRIEKTLMVSKSSFTRSLNQRLKGRTPFESSNPIKESQNPNLNRAVEVISYQVEFKFPSGRTVTLTEELDKPNGITKLVNLVDSDGIPLKFTKFIEAESEVVARFLEDSAQSVRTEIV